MNASQTRSQRFFAAVGYLIVSVIASAALIELGARVIWSGYHWIRHRPDEIHFASTSPAYANYPWAKEYWKDEEARWNVHTGVYQPFRIWGVSPFHSTYVNNDESPFGTWRRTMNPVDSGCDHRPHTDIWIFGGSTVYGTGVPDWATVPSLLSRDLNSSESPCVFVINFGTEGYVTNQELILLTEQLKAGHRPSFALFYDGVNESYAGAVSPGIATAHISLERIRALVDGSIASKFDFLQNSYALQLARAASGSVGRVHAAEPLAPQANAKAVAALDNYEANLRLARILGQGYGFRVMCFWQPAFVYGRKPLDPFEKAIPRNESEMNAFQIMGVVYQEAARRSSTNHHFVFLGNILDSVHEPLYIDKWMHLSPQGNEIVAQTLANAIQDELRRH